MVCHETVGEDLQPESAGIFMCQLKIPLPVRIAEKHILTAIAPLRDVIWETWKDNPRDSRHSSVQAVKW